MQWKALPVSKKDHYALTGATVREALEADKKKGLIPFLLSAHGHFGAKITHSD